MTTRTGRESDQLLIRLPDGMKDRIAEAARASGRSMTAEIVHRLYQSFGEVMVGYYDDPNIETVREMLAVQHHETQRLVEDYAKAQQAKLDEAMSAQREALEKLVRDQLIHGFEVMPDQLLGGPGKNPLKKGMR